MPLIHMHYSLKQALKHDGQNIKRGGQERPGISAGIVKSSSCGTGLGSARNLSGCGFRNTARFDGPEERRIAASQAIPLSCCFQQGSIVSIGGFAGNGGTPSAVAWNTSAENFQ
jgi:hypothetical protein